MEKIKLNCWEWKKCGRQPGGEKTGELGICPAALDRRFSGINSGVNAGRACWVIKGTLCDAEPQGNFVLKIAQCTKCDFYMHVRIDEGSTYKNSKTLLEMLAGDDSDK